MGDSSDLIVWDMEWNTSFTRPVGASHMALLPRGTPYNTTTFPTTFSTTSWTTLTTTSTTDTATTVTTSTTTSSITTSSTEEIPRTPLGEGDALAWSLIGGGFVVCVCFRLCRGWGQRAERGRSDLSNELQSVQMS